MFLLVADKFDVRDFHDAVLRTGSAPLDVVEKSVNDYITEMMAPATTPKNPGTSHGVKVHSPVLTMISIMLLYYLWK